VHGLEGGGGANQLVGEFSTVVVVVFGGLVDLIARVAGLVCGEGLVGWMGVGGKVVGGACYDKGG